MAVPYSNKKEFKLGDVNFSSYQAQDVHGSRSNVYFIDGKVVDYDVYWRKIISALKEMGSFESISMAIEINKYS